MTAHSIQEFRRRSPFNTHMGIDVIEAEPGRSRCQLQDLPALRNTRGLLHGGAIFSLVDTAMGVAQHLGLREGETSATLEVQISYLKPVISGSPVCEARVTKHGSRVIFLEAEVHNGGDLVATATGSYALTNRE